jgi:radical SAM protein with 4Fe4S-binding SPASM domain
MVVTPATVGSLLPAVERLYRLGASRISLLPDLEADWLSVEEQAQQVWSQLARICLLSMCTDQPLYLAPFSSYFPANEVFPSEGQGACDFGGSQVTIAPSGNLYPCARLVGTDRRCDVRVGHVTTGWDTGKAEQLRDDGDEGLRQGGCGKGGCQCIPLMPGDTKVQLDHSARFAHWTRDAAAPVSREIEEALGLVITS